MDIPTPPSALTPPRALDTEAVHAGRDDLAGQGLHAPPIDLSTTYPSYDSRAEADRVDAFAATGAEPDGPPVYGRLGNPTVARFETALARLEGTGSAVAFASGMAALTAVLLARAALGLRHVVAVRPLYGCSDHLLTAGLLGTEVTWTDPAGIADALRPDTGLVMVETPANPTLAEIDLRAVAHACGSVPLLADNTFATPVLQRPADQGARLVLHSATKYLGGHGDVLGGVVACDEELAGALRRIRFATGGVLHPLAGYLLLRGLATLPVRVRAASATAAELARRLTADPRVARVCYPRIGGAMIAFEPYGDRDPHDLIAAVRLITPAVSLGSVDTLIQHPASISHRVVAPDDRRDAGVGDRLLRLSVGLEDVDDLWADLDRGLGGRGLEDRGLGGRGLGEGALGEGAAGRAAGGRPDGRVGAGAGAGTTGWAGDAHPATSGAHSAIPEAHRAIPGACSGTPGVRPAAP